MPEFSTEYQNLLPKDNFFAGLDAYKDAFCPDNIFTQKGLVYSIMGSFAANREFEAFSASREDRLLIKTLKFIEKNYAGECSLKAAANELSYGYSHLSRTFKRLMQMSYNEYLNRYRINRAVYLLSGGGKMRVQDAALACGYDSLCSFNRNFKDFTGVTPRELTAETRRVNL